MDLADGSLASVVTQRAQEVPNVLARESNFEAEFALCGAEQKLGLSVGGPLCLLRGSCTDASPPPVEFGSGGFLVLWNTPRLGS